LIAAGPLADFAMQHEALTPQQTHATFWLTGALGLLVALGLAAFANWDPRSISAILPWLGVSVAFNGLAATPFALLIREMRFKALAARPGRRSCRLAHRGGWRLHKQSRDHPPRPRHAARTER